MAARRRKQNYAFWTGPELRILRRQVAALVEGRCRRLQDAVEACKMAMDRQRRLKPNDYWPSFSRPASAVRAKLKEEARRAGWQSLRVHWSPEERAVLDRHVAALLQGQFHAPKQAARSCVAELEAVGRRLRRQGRKPVRRSLLAVRDRILKRAHGHGWSRAEMRWLPEERRILDKHARRLIRLPGLQMKTAVRDCRRDLRRLHARLRRVKPERFRRVVPRTDATLRRILGQSAAEMGRPVPDAWRPDENRVIRRFARAVLDDRYPDVETAAPACARALGRLRRRWRVTAPARFKQTSPRTVIGTRNHLLELTHSYGQRWPHSGWTAAELRACRSWVRTYMRNRDTPGYLTWTTAAEGLREELSQLRSRRTAGGCVAQMWAQRRRMYGPT
jgi:hypothetical protein